MCVLYDDPPPCLRLKDARTPLCRRRKDARTTVPKDARTTS